MIHYQNPISQYVMMMMMMTMILLIMMVMVHLTFQMNISAFGANSIITNLHTAHSSAQLIDPKVCVKILPKIDLLSFGKKSPIIYFGQLNTVNFSVTSNSPIRCTQTITVTFFFFFVIYLYLIF